MSVPTVLIPGRSLGRVPPVLQYDYGRFRAVLAADGVTRYFPRVSKHTDGAKRAAPIPAGPLGRKAKAAAAIARMYRNDAEGDCVIASRKHRVGIQTGNDTGTPVLATDAECDSDYHAACGAGDNGCSMSVVNKYEQSTGMLMSGVRHKTDGAAAVDWTNADLVRTVIDAFGTVDVGMSLPNAWYTSAEGADWGVTTSQIVGGHEVQAFDYDPQGVWIATWGGTRRILWAAFTSRKWLDECYTSLSKDWYGADNLAPSGIDAATLKADLALVASGQIPPLVVIPPTPPPPVVPPVVPPTPPPPVPAGLPTVLLSFATGAAPGTYSLDLSKWDGTAGAGLAPINSGVATVLDATPDGSYLAVFQNDTRTFFYHAPTKRTFVLHPLPAVAAAIRT